LYKELLELYARHGSCSHGYTTYFTDLHFFRSYSGYSTNDKQRMNIEELQMALQKDNRPYRDAVFYTAGYDNPYAVNRHNEIWFSAE